MQADVGSDGSVQRLASVLWVILVPGPVGGMVNFGRPEFDLSRRGLVAAGRRSSPAVRRERIAAGL